MLAVASVSVSIVQVKYIRTTLLYSIMARAFLSIFLLAPLPFHLLVHFLRLVSLILTWTVPFIRIGHSPIPEDYYLLCYGALLKGKSEHHRIIQEKENNTFFSLFLFLKIILFGDPSTNPLPVWNRLKIELIGLGPRRIGGILTPPIHPLTEGSRKR